MPLYTINPRLTIYLICDAATGPGGGYSGTFYQHNEHGNRCPILIIAGLWNRTRGNMTPGDQELLAMTLSVRRGRKLKLPFTDITVRSDHSNIRHAFTSTSPVVHRWPKELTGMRIQHVPGVINSADALSRSSTTQQPNGVPFHHTVEQCHTSILTASLLTTQSSATVLLGALRRSAALAAEKEKPAAPAQDPDGEGLHTDAVTRRYESRLSDIARDQAILFNNHELTSMETDPTFRHVTLAGGLRIWVRHGRIVIPQASPLVETLLKEAHNKESIHGGITDLKTRVDGYYRENKNSDTANTACFCEFELGVPLGRGAAWRGFRGGCLALSLSSEERGFRPPSLLPAFAFLSRSACPPESLVRPARRLGEKELEASSGALSPVGRLFTVTPVHPLMMVPLLPVYDSVGAAVFEELEIVVMRMKTAVMRMARGKNMGRTHQGVGSG